MAPVKRKQRVLQHVMESVAIRVVEELLPRGWVARQYRPDYGLDLAIETFQELDGKRGSFETMGEHFFVQVKSVQRLVPKEIRVKPRLNVAKYPLTTPHAGKTSLRSLKTISFPIETSLLNTVQAMGASVVVHLFLVGLEEQRVFFLCLNDYIEKILLPKGREFSRQTKVTLHIPITNEIAKREGGNHHLALAFFAKRAKFYSAFNIFCYQQNELGYCNDNAAARKMAAHFIQILKGLDIWDCPMWRIVDHYRRWLAHLSSALPNLPDVGWFAAHPASEWSLDYVKEGAKREVAFHIDLHNFWNGLIALSHNYEEFCREWFLATHFAELLREPSL